MGGKTETTGAESGTITPQNATRGDFVKQIRKLHWYLWLIANRPLEFNTACRALAQEALLEKQLIEPESDRLMWHDELTEAQRDRTLRRDSVAGGNKTILQPKGGKGMDQGEKTAQNARTAQEPAKVIDLIDVESSNIARVGHDGEKTLRVVFKSDPGHPWDYQGIAPGEFIDLVNADSVGRTLIQLTKNRGIKGAKVAGRGIA